MKTAERFDPATQALRLPRGFDMPFAEAIAWAEQRQAALPAEFYVARLQAVRARSFAVTGLATLDQVQQVADAAAAATASGQSFRDWQRRVLASDASGELLGLGRARRELIFRNAVQTNYGIGRTIQQRENAAARPYLMWDAINDSRTRDSHRAMDGHIAPIDAPVWRRWHPPAGHRCRCTRIALTEAQARARGYPKPTPSVEPDKGWEGDPTEDNEDLVRVVQARRDACGVGFAAVAFAYKRVGQPLWCAGPGQELAQRLDYALRTGKRSLSEPLAMQYRVLTFIQQAEVSGGQGAPMVVGNFTQQRELFQLIGADALSINRVSIQPSYLLHIKHQHGPGGIKTDRGLTLPEHVAAVVGALPSAKFRPYDGTVSHARLPLVSADLELGAESFRAVFEVKPGKRALTLFNLYRLKKSAGEV